MKAPGVVARDRRARQNCGTQVARRTGGPSIPDLMIGEGTHRTNQRRKASQRRTVRLNSCAPFLLALFAAS